MSKDDLLEDIKKEEHAIRIKFYRDKIIKLCLQLKDQLNNNNNKLIEDNHDNVEEIICVDKTSNKESEELSQETLIKSEDKVKQIEYQEVNKSSNKAIEEDHIQNSSVLSHLNERLQESRTFIENQYNLKLQSIYTIKKIKGKQILDSYNKLSKVELIQKTRPVLIVIDTKDQYCKEDWKYSNKDKIVRFPSDDNNRNDEIINSSRPNSAQKSERITNKFSPVNPKRLIESNVAPAKRRPASVGRGGPAASNASGLNFHKLSNMQQVKNALSNVCLAGSHHDSQRIEACDAIDEAYFEGLVLSMTSDACIKISQFVILFYHSKSLAFRGVYGVIPQSTNLIRIYGRGAKDIHENMIESYWKYSTSSRGFVELPSKSLTSTTDAISIDPSKLKNK